MTEISRRRFVRGSAAVIGGSLVSRAAFARVASNRRFVFLIQRGAADGLSTVAPVGDPDFERQRGVLAVDARNAIKLDSLFALHPALSAVGGMYQAGEALFFHAVASPYRDRSHFDGQNVLETGGADAYTVRDGWLNRLLGLLPGEQAKAIAIATTVPMALRGPFEVATYAPSTLPDASHDLLDRVEMLYANDAQLRRMWSEAMATRVLANGVDAPTGPRDAAATGALAAKLLSSPSGPRLAMIETNGWDTHAQQSPRLALQLRGLDQLVGALKSGLGPLWAETMVLVATEFGRTVRVNGTAGTDHGTAGCALVLGGAVLGGRVVADWPGLRDTALYEGRDLRPTLALDTIIGSAIAEHFGLDPVRVRSTLFPGASPTSQLVGIKRS